VRTSLCPTFGRMPPKPRRREHLYSRQSGEKPTHLSTLSFPGRLSSGQIPPWFSQRLRTTLRIIPHFLTKGRRPLFASYLPDSPKEWLFYGPHCDGNNNINRDKTRLVVPHSPKEWPSDAPRCASFSQQRRTIRRASLCLIPPKTDDKTRLVMPHSPKDGGITRVWEVYTLYIPGC